jgi:MFS family permease
MAPIGIVAMLSQTHGEYWLAGAVSATFALTNALVAPQISRLVDRYGQAAVLTPATIVSVLAFCPAPGDPPALAGVDPVCIGICRRRHASIPAMVRARWSNLFRDRPELNTAFAFESAADELMYIAGASLSVGLSVALFPEAGVLVSTVLLAVGSTLFLIQRSTEPPVRPGPGVGWFGDPA